MPAGKPESARGVGSLGSGSRSGGSRGGSAPSGGVSSRAYPKSSLSLPKSNPARPFAPKKIVTSKSKYALMV